MLEIKGVERGDYFEIVCVKCDQATENEYLGGVVPQFRATCQKCGSNEWKLDAALWEGLPFKPFKSD